MPKRKIIYGFLGIICLLSPMEVRAAGSSGFFGGITEGVRLPKTTELLIVGVDSEKPGIDVTDVAYKEIVFLDGIPQEFTGLLTVKYQGKIGDEVDLGSCKVTYTVKADPAITSDISIERQMVFDVNWRRDKDKNQLIKDFTINRWQETIKAKGGTFVLNEKRSHFDVSVLEDKRAGVLYYKGDQSQLALYMNGQEEVKLETIGSFYGYESAWSQTEVHRIDGYVFATDWQMQYQVRPSVSVSKRLEYGVNEPTNISFGGNYRELMSNSSGLQYDVFLQPYHAYGTPKTGQTNLSTYTAFEQLTAPDMSFLKGHFAEADISKLFAMEVLEGNPEFYRPNEAITRGQFITMLVKGIKLPVEAVETAKGRGKKPVTINVVFPDVFPERPDYPYIMAAYKGGLAMGRGQGYFHADATITRQEAIVLVVRALGLSNLGLSPTPQTAFTDDSDLAAWAKKEISAARRMGIIQGDAMGKLHPTEEITKAEAAAIINRLINYMRTDLAIDYTEHIVHFSD